MRPVEDGSPADDAGLQEGDIIRSFNGHTTLDADELTAAVREVPAGGKGELVYERNGQEKTVEVTVGNAADAD
ncbi:PDZ domain-containing protein [Kocuria sp. SL71]|nr:PDZ domain-containing protein [Kocuria sp. SL71]